MRIADITVPYAIADFAILRERGFYYVDPVSFDFGVLLRH